MDFFLNFLSMFFGISRVANDVGEYARPMVRTSHGFVEGRLTTLSNYVDVDTFYGVPYARKPVQQLRFEKTYLTAAWPETIVADQLQPPCPLKPPSSDEDCLYLNVLRPSTRIEVSPGPFPVIIIIPGAEPDDQFTARDHSLLIEHFVGKGAIVVTIAYRVGYLGFLSSDGDDIHPAKNNYGLYDLVVAVDFVYEELRRFNGDPSQVTLFGEGGGGYAAALVARSQLLAHRPFSRVVQIAGFAPSTAFTQAPAVIREHSKAFVEKAQSRCADEFYKECIQDMRLDSLFKNQADFFALNHLPTKDFSFEVKPGGSKHFLLGVNQFDNRSKGVMQVLNRHDHYNYSTLEFEVQRHFESKEAAREIVKFYNENSDFPSSNPEFYKNVVFTLIYDIEFTLPAITEAQAYVRAGHKVWFYEFSRPDYLGPVISNLDSNHMTRVALSKLLLEFSTTGVVKIDNENVPSLPSSLDNLPYVHFERDNVSIMQNYRPLLRNFWKSLYDRYTVSWESVRIH